MTPKLVNGGINLILRAMDGEGIEFSKIEIGNGEKPDDYKSLTGLMNRQAVIELDNCSREDDYILLQGTLKNSEITAGFDWTEIGVFCTNPDGGDDIMYAYRHYLIEDNEGEAGGGATYIPKFGDDVVELTISIYVYIGTIENVTAALAASSEYATKAELEQHMNDEQNGHHVSAEQVGLGNVPNVATNDQTPTYTIPSARTALTSGERLSAAMGKIARAILDLISHISNTTMHITAAERTAWNSKAAASHNHSASNITSGTLGVARGGTGATTAEAAVHALFGVYCGAVSSAYVIPDNANLNSYRKGGTWWCTSSVHAKTFKNCPYTGSNFTFVVFAPYPDVQVFQIILPNGSDPSPYVRAYNSGNWYAWRKITTSAV